MQAKNVLVDIYREYRNKYPNASKITTAILVVTKWTISIVLVLVIILAAYGYTRSQSEEVQGIHEREPYVDAEAFLQERNSGYIPVNKRFPNPSELPKLPTLP